MSSSAFIASIFWLLAGVLIGVAATLALGAVWRTQRRQVGEKLGQWRSLVFATAGITVTALLAVSLYLLLGRPDLIAGRASVAEHTSGANGAAVAQSMEAVTAQLADRLAREGGSDSDWELLAQSYEFIGQTDAAAQARKHIVNNNSIAGPAAAQAAPPTKEALALLETARQFRLQRKYADAKAAYEQAIAKHAMTADSWADYADTLAALQPGKTKLTGAPAKAIDAALRLNPNHPKALWLKASLAHEEQRYADALATWQQLRRVIGDNESDARIIDANIAEAQELAGAAPTQASGAFISGSVVTGTIDIDPALAARATPGATLFIYAKAIDVPGPPLAVYRTTVRNWPMQFRLDDSMAMLPSRNLSSAAQVIVEARVSQSGQAIAVAGDLQTNSERVTVSEGKPVRLRIGKVVG